jgi:glycosyltransferase involved in cell wall biosynthesis
MINKKILFVTKDISANENSDGTSIILHNLLSRLSNYSIEVIYFGVKNLDAEKYFTKQKVKVHHQNLIINKVSFSETVRGFKFLKPFNSFKFKYSLFNIELFNCYDYYCFLGFESGFLIPFFRETSNKNIIYFQIDSLSLYYKRAFSISKSLIHKIYNRLQFHLIHKCEKIFYSLSSKIIFISTVDKVFAINLFSNIPSEIFFNLKLGIDESNHMWNFNEVRSDFNVVFTGNLDYKPNFEAASFIINKILPQFSELNFNLKFHIVGKYSKNLKVDLGINDDDRVVIPGFVDDLNEYLSKMDVFISPLFIGSGMKNKILKSMSIGVPIICTSLSVDGIEEMVDGLNCFICDSNSGIIWKDKLLSLLLNERLMNSFSNNTISIAKAHYNWNYLVNDFIKIID